MGKNDNIKAEDAPTDPTDWIGAAVVRPGEKRRDITSETTMFHVYRSSKDTSLFVIIDCDNQSKLPECPGNGTWEFFKRFPETGQPRIGFSEEYAKRDIHESGYHLNRIDIETAERTMPSKAS
ncbi:MAG: hypothetical protein V3R66_04090 [Rhodospirillales bacterium]